MLRIWIIQTLTGITQLLIGRLADRLRRKHPGDLQPPLPTDLIEYEDKSSGVLVERVPELTGKALPMQGELPLEVLPEYRSAKTGTPSDETLNREASNLETSNPSSIERDERWTVVRYPSGTVLMCPDCGGEIPMSALRRLLR